MADETQPESTQQTGSDRSSEPATSGHVERTILNQLVSDERRYVPTAVSDVLDAVAGVIRRGDYGNLGPRGATKGTVRKSTIRRAFIQLEEKGLVQRVEEISEAEVTNSRYDLGECVGDDPSDPASYAGTADDARVTDWILTDEGLAEIKRLDARYEAALDDLAARFGRAHGETTRRIDA